MKTETARDLCAKSTFYLQSAIALAESSPFPGLCGIAGQSTQELCQSPEWRENAANDAMASQDRAASASRFAEAHLFRPHAHGKYSLAAPRFLLKERSPRTAAADRPRN
jgi:hypothetical protein